MIGQTIGNYRVIAKLGGAGRGAIAAQSVA